MKRKYNADSLLKMVALFAALFSWMGMIGIVLFADVPSYVKWVCGLYVFGTSTLFYLDNKKDM